MAPPGGTDSIVTLLATHRSTYWPSQPPPYLPQVVRELRAVARFHQSKPPWKGKKLHQITSMREEDGEVPMREDDEKVTVYHARWALLVEDAFQRSGAAATPTCIVFKGID